MPALRSKSLARHSGLAEAPLDWNFHRYLTAFALSAFGDSVTMLALTFAVLDITGSAGDLGIVLLSGRLPMIAFLLFGGVIGDRWPRKRVMIGADVVRFIAQGTLAILVILHRAHLWQIVVLYAICGAAFAFFSPATTGLIRDLVPPTALQKANGRLNFVRNMCSMVALGVSATLVETIGSGYALAIQALTFAVSALLVNAIGMKTDSRMTGRESLLSQLKEGYTYLRESVWIRVVVIHCGLINGCVIAPILVLGPVVAQRHLSGAASWATIGVATTVGALLGSLVGGRWKTDRLLAAGIGVVLAGVPMSVSLALATPTYLVSAAAVLFGLQSSIYMTATQTVLQQRVPGALIGRVSAYFSVGGLVLMPVGLASAGAAAQRFGTEPVLWLASAILVSSTLIALAFPQIRHPLRAGSEAVDAAVREPDAEQSCNK
jgi:hypothetical protein